MEEKHDVCSIGIRGLTTQRTSERVVGEICDVLRWVATVRECAVFHTLGDQLGACGRETHGCFIVFRDIEHILGPVLVESLFSWSCSTNSEERERRTDGTEHVSWVSMSGRLDYGLVAVSVVGFTSFLWRCCFAVNPKVEGNIKVCC